MTVSGPSETQPPQTNAPHSSSPPPTGGRGIVVVACVVIICAGLQAAKGIVVPFLLAAFIATIASTPMFWLREKKVPDALALGLVVLAIFAALALIAALLTQSTSAFSAKLPSYQERLGEFQQGITLLLTRLNMPVDLSSLADSFSLGSALTIAGTTLSSLGSVLSNSFLIILTVIFILAEATSFYPKLRAVLSNPERDLAYFSRVAETMNRYIAIKTSMSLLTGALASLSMLVLGVDFPILWGLVAMLLNFVPTIGSIFAAIPPVLLALVELGVGTAGLVTLAYVMINMIVGNILEPRFMGQGLGLSTLVVFLSLIFWGWILGPVGMLLSVPLTMTVKIALEASAQTLWIAQLLGQGEGLSAEIEE